MSRMAVVFADPSDFNRIGLPRPVAKSPDGKLRPVPWSQDDSWGVIHSTRQSTSEDRSLCLVCGTHVAEGKVIVALSHVNSPPELVFSKNLGALWILDGGPLHDRCAKITAAHCQTVREGIRSDRFSLIDYLDTRIEGV